jgi:hypothetical protein
MPLATLDRLSEHDYSITLNIWIFAERRICDLIDDIELQEAFEQIMYDLRRDAWVRLSGIAPEAIPPVLPFATPHPTQIQMNLILDRTRHWVIEGYRRRASLGVQRSARASTLRARYARCPHCAFEPSA